MVGLKITQKSLWGEGFAFLGRKPQISLTNPFLKACFKDVFVLEE